MKTTILTVSPMPHMARRSHGNYCIPGIEAGQEYATLTVEDATDYRVLYVDNVFGGPQKPEYIPVPISAELVAMDLVTNERHKLSDREDEHEGIIVLQGETPSATELAAAKKARANYLVACVRMGDEMFSRYGQGGVGQIPDFCKRACEELSERRDWVFVQAIHRIQCEGCGKFTEPLLDGSRPAICGGCGAIMDYEKAVRLGLAPTSAGHVETPEAGSATKPLHRDARTK